MNITISNDGKERAQSYEAKIELTSDNKYWGFYESKFVGYGANAWSAKMNLIEQTENLIQQLHALKELNK